ncbi:MAG: hypothetical protein M0Q21_12770 [Ignavibacteriaceae bacterium]|nr:hypothetical protein [Ignavibacteriaceae bacterium]
MKFNLAILTLIVVFVSLLGCKDPKTGIVIPETVEKYPTTLNTEWEYETASYVAKYDKNGNLGNDSLLQPTTHSILKISSINDSINEEKNLVRFDFSYKSESPIVNHWYRNSNSTFERIAFSGYSEVWVTPKIRKSDPLIFLKHLSRNLFPDGIIFSTNDSAYFSKKIILQYPLVVGKSWDVFYAKDYFISKTIVGKRLMIFNGTNVECFDIKSIYYRGNGLDRQTDEHDYISLEYGLVMRETIIDSLPLTTVENPYGTGEFLRYKSTSTLIRKSN